MEYEDKQDKNYKFIAYEIYSDLTDKSYYGITNNLILRMANHRNLFRKGSKLPLYRALRKYGIENFRVRIAAYSNSRESICKAEQAFIKSAKDCGCSYNCTTGGDNNYKVSRHPRVASKLNKKKSKARWLGKSAEFRWPLKEILTKSFKEVAYLGIPKTTYYRTKKRFGGKQ